MQLANMLILQKGPNPTAQRKPIILCKASLRPSGAALIYTRVTPQNWCREKEKKKKTPIALIEVQSRERGLKEKKKATGFWKSWKLRKRKKVPTFSSVMAAVFGRALNVNRKAELWGVTWLQPRANQPPSPAAKSSRTKARFKTRTKRRSAQCDAAAPEAPQLDDRPRPLTTAKTNTTATAARAKQEDALLKRS